MISAVAPQKRGLIPDEHAAELLAARENLTFADERYRTAVADALKAGGSVREVAALTGLTTRTVHRWGNDRGWPTAEQKRERDDARARNAEWRQQMGHDE